MIHNVRHTCIVEHKQAVLNALHDCAMITHYVCLIYTI